MRSRVSALLAKELLEVRRHPAALLPVVLVALVSLGLAFSMLFLVPFITGEPLGRDADLLKIAGLAGIGESLPADARVELFLARQLLLLFMLVPVTGSMALAAHAVVGEKQARTLEPLLATPLTTVELLLAKVLGALLPPLAVGFSALAVFFGGLGVWGKPGVLGELAGPYTLVMLLLVGPAAALVSLQAALVVSSRVNDARTAQQFGVLIILPITGLLVAQFSGALWLSAGALALAGVGLLGVWLLLVFVSVVVFQRDTILTRWK